MELAIFLPTMFLALAFAASVLLYSVQKVFGPGVLSLRNKAQVGVDTGDATTPTGDQQAACSRPKRPLPALGLASLAA